MTQNATARLEVILAGVFPPAAAIRRDQGGTDASIITVMITPHGGLYRLNEKDATSPRHTLTLDHELAQQCLAGLLASNQRRWRSMHHLLHCLPPSPQTQSRLGKHARSRRPRRQRMPLPPARLQQQSPKPLPSGRRSGDDAVT